MHGWPIFILHINPESTVWLAFENSLYLFVQSCSELKTLFKIVSTELVIVIHLLRLSQEDDISKANLG